MLSYSYQKFNSTMALQLIKPYLLFTLSLLFISSPTATALSLSSPSEPPSVYELLPNYGLPAGLLPDCVKSYSLSEDDGKFEVELSEKCYIKFDYLVYYDTRITGTLKYGSITDLKGIQVQRFFVWFDVDEIKVDLPPSDSIYFQVGILNKKLGVDQFKTVHSCRKNVALTRKLIFELPAPVRDEIPMLLTE